MLRAEQRCPGGRAGRGWGHPCSRPRFQPCTGGICPVRRWGGFCPRRVLPGDPEAGGDRKQPRTRELALPVPHSRVSFAWGETSSSGAASPDPAEAGTGSSRERDLPFWSAQRTACAAPMLAGSRRRHAGCCPKPPAPPGCLCPRFATDPSAPGPQRSFLFPPTPFLGLAKGLCGETPAAPRLTLALARGYSCSLQRGGVIFHPHKHPSPFAPSSLRGQQPEEIAPALSFCSSAPVAARLLPCLLL